VLAEARRARQPLRIQEWPGGALTSRVRADVRVTPEVLTQVRRGRSTVPLGKGRPRVELLSLPHYSLVRLRATGEEQLVSALPARFSAGQWHLPIGVFPVDAQDRTEELLRTARRVRHEDLLEAVSV
jgi:hypothetical protein